MNLILYQAIEYVSLSDMQNVCLINKAVYGYCKEWKTYLMKRLIEYNGFKCSNRSLKFKSLCGSMSFGFGMDARKSLTFDTQALFTWYLQLEIFNDLFSGAVFGKKRDHILSKIIKSASKNKPLKCIKLLRKRNLENPMHQLEWAIHKKRFETAVTEYHKLPQFAETNLVDWASEQGYKQFVIYLLKNDFDCTTDAIDLASEKGHRYVVESLLERGKECTVRAMDKACKNGHLETVRILHRFKKKYTEYALEFAVENGHLGVVDFLVCVVQMKHTDKTIQLARKNTKMDVVNLLEKIARLKMDGLFQRKCTTQTVKSIKPLAPPQCTERIESPGGYFELKKYFDIIGQLSTEDAVKWASENNHPDLVEYLQGIEVV